MIKAKKILEPSAGKANICDWLVEMKGCRKENIDCIEKVPELCSILKEKNYRVISNDFLTFNPDGFYDLIVMNPPFDAGAKHLLKAIEISDGTEIRCLLNAETINNPHSEERKLLLRKIEEFKGEIKNLGAAFKLSERKTNVEVVMIKINIPESKCKFEFERGHRNEKDFDFEDVQTNQVAQNDYFGNLETQYSKCKEIASKIISLENELNFYSSYLSDLNTTADMLRSSTGGGKYRYNEFIDKLRTASWESIMRKTKISDLVTTEVRKNFFKFQQEQGYMAFTKENMMNLLEGLYHGQSDIMTNCIIEAFDIMTKYHDENRIHIEGWKTNKSWKVTKKVIIPNMRDDWSDTPRLTYQAKDKMADIEKAMSFIMKKSYDKCNTIQKTIEAAYKRAEISKNYFDDCIKYGE